VSLNQVWEDSNSIDSIYYEYKPDDFDTKCYEQKDVPVGSTYDDSVTIQCYHSKPIARLKICLEDSEFLTLEDDGTIPKCCHPDEESGDDKDPKVVCYTLEINCKPGCPEDDIQQPVRSLRGKN